MCSPRRVSVAMLGFRFVLAARTRAPAGSCPAPAPSNRRLPCPGDAEPRVSRACASPSRVGLQLRGVCRIGSTRSRAWPERSGEVLSIVHGELLKLARESRARPLDRRGPLMTPRRRERSGALQSPSMRPRGWIARTRGATASATPRMSVSRRRSELQSWSERPLGRAVSRTCESLRMTQ